MLLYKVARKHTYDSEGKKKNMHLSIVTLIQWSICWNV